MIYRKDSFRFRKESFMGHTLSQLHFQGRCSLCVLYSVRFCRYSETVKEISDMKMNSDTKYRNIGQKGSMNILTLAGMILAAGIIAFDHLITPLPNWVAVVLYSSAVVLFVSGMAAGAKADRI